MIVPVAALAWLAGCQSRQELLPVQVANVDEIRLASEVDFVGNEACRECHAKEFGMHAGSKHDMTLQTVETARTRQVLPPTKSIPGGLYALEQIGDTLQFATTTPPVDSAPIELVFGSGKTGITFAGGFDHSGFTEFRMSYDVRRKTWIPTPGQETASDLALGRRKAGDEALRCLSCHSVFTGDVPKPPEIKLTGVTCERCHGGAAAHIAAARTSGAQDLKMKKLGLLAGKDMNAVCSQCHMSAVDVPLANVDISSTNRFQTYGLEASPCFIKSGGKLNCVTCHDPHTNLVTGEAPYVNNCLSCHSAASTVETRGTNDHVTICPVNPKDKCVSCHMPKRPLVPGAHIKHESADHLIWAYRKHR
jgi:hypothetical protein